MDLIEKYYQEKCVKQSDINEHLPVLRALAEECDHVTEMGVRDVVSTWAFISAQPKVLRSYDIVKSDNIEKALELAPQIGVDMKFTEADVLKIEIKPTELLFIDTLHTYSQLKKELELHASKVSKYIVFHDVVTYGHIPEPSQFNTHNGIVKQHDKILANYVENDLGIMPAIEEFIDENDWKVKKFYTNNNGLLIIERING